MAIGIILGIILVVLAIGSIALAIWGFNEDKMGGGVIGVVIAVIAVITLLIVPFSFKTVDAGEVAVVKHLGQAKEVRTAGTYFDFWITEKYERYDAKVQNVEITSAAYSKDAQTMDIIMTLQYQIDTSKALEIVNKYGSLEALGDRIKSVAVEKTKATLSSYSAMDIIENRSAISPEVESTIKNSIDETYCVNIVAVVLTNIDFSDAFEATVENKMIAEQEKLKAEYEKETAIVNAEKELEVAKLNAQAKVAQAEADAEAQIRIAQAEAESIQLKSIEVARSLGFTIIERDVVDDGVVTGIEYEIDFDGKTQEEISLIVEYLKYAEYLSKWDGKLPTVMTDNGAQILIPNSVIND